MTTYPISIQDTSIPITANSNYTVLVVDDDVPLNHMLREALLGVGFNVLSSNSGLKGLDTIRYGSKVDVVLLDYSMTTLNGLQTLEHLDKYFPNVKVIGVTGFDISELPEAYRNGVDKLLPKPITISDLISAIHSVLGVQIGAETSKPKTDWTRFGLWCAFFAICYGIFRLLYPMASKELFLR
jgi:CheY-like chemotaxis protein